MQLPMAFVSTFVGNADGLLTLERTGKDHIDGLQESPGQWWTDGAADRIGLFFAVLVLQQGQ